MAIAERVPTGETFIEMTLTEEEAEALWLVTRRVGGDPEGRRGHIDEIRAALVDAGVYVPGDDAYDDTFGRGSIHLN